MFLSLSDPPGWLISRLSMVPRWRIGIQYGPITVFPNYHHLTHRSQITRHGLWFKTDAHGRAFGDGTYSICHLFPHPPSYDQRQASTCRRWIDLHGRLRARQRQHLAAQPGHTQVLFRCSGSGDRNSKFVSNNPHYVVTNDLSINLQDLVGALD